MFRVTTRSKTDHYAPGTLLVTFERSSLLMPEADPDQFGAALQQLLPEDCRVTVERHCSHQTVVVEQSVRTRAGDMQVLKQVHELADEQNLEVYEDRPLTYTERLRSNLASVG